MSTLLDVLTGIGVALAVGLRPFLPALVVGLLALANATIDFDGTSFSFLESPVVLVVLAVLGVGLIAARRDDDARVQHAALSLGVVLGALLFAATLDDHSDVWWPGLILGAACAVLAGFATRGLLTRVRARMDADTQRTLPAYLEVGAVLLALLSVLLPPVGLVGLVGAVLLLRGGRRREGEKYAGLRVLR
jgi:hypothetical protein